MLTALQQAFQTSNKNFAGVPALPWPQSGQFETVISNLHTTEYSFYTPRRPDRYIFNRHAGSGAAAIRQKSELPKRVPRFPRIAL